MLGAAPEVAALVRDLLAADLLGFQTDNDVANFAAAAQSLVGATKLANQGLQFGGRRVKLGVFPVEIEAQGFALMAARNAYTAGGERLRRSLEGQKLILGVDRLDPTKGLMQRLAGLECFFDKHPEWRRKATMVQIAAESRKDVGSYQALRAALDSAAGSLNADFGEPEWQPLRMVSRAVDRAAVAGYMRLAAIGLVTPLRDGMNLVAKEYVAAQEPDDPGVLVLSRFAGAARQLDAALLVNPHDPDAMADAIDTALRMDIAERRARWRSLWDAISDRTPALWGRSFLASLMRATLPASKPAKPEPVVVSSPPKLTLVEPVAQGGGRRG